MNASLIVGLALAVAAPAPKTASKDEPPSLHGEWVLESAVRGGMNDKPPDGAGVTFTADGKARFREGRRDKVEEGTYTVDPKKNPAQIDIVPPANEKVPTVLGIYKIEKDTLTLCLVLGGERPKKFESPAGSEVMLMTLKRVKKD
jgi:uncharacterized protein (TIGR03067 family)